MIRAATLFLLLVACGDNAPQELTWGDAVQHWDHAACDLTWRCLPSGAAWFGGDYDRCLAYYDARGCSDDGTGFSCGDPYPWPAEYAERCEEDMDALPCDLDFVYFVAPASCTAAFWVPGHGSC